MHRITDKGLFLPGKKQDVFWKGYQPNTKDYLGQEYKVAAPYMLNPDLLVTRFNLRSIEYGNWLTYGDRIDQTYALALSLDHLATVLGIKPSSIGLFGTLTIGLGSRGLPKSKAHFKPKPYIFINLNKKNGKGSLAHEYMHALDNILTVIIPGVTSFLSRDYFPRYRPVKITDKTPENLKSALKPLNQVFKVLIETGYIERLLSSNATDYYKDPAEILARSFEFYIALQLDERNITNEFLAKRLSTYRSKDPFVPQKFPKEQEIKAAAYYFKTFYNTVFVLLERYAMQHTRKGVALKIAEKPLI